MQLFLVKMRFFRPCMALLMSLALFFSMAPLAVSATEEENQEPMTSLTNYGDTWILMQGYWDLAGSVMLGELSDLLWPGSGSGASIVKNSAWYCSAAESQTGSRTIHFFPETGHASLRSRSCQYCGISWTQFLADIILAEDEFVSSLDSTVIGTGGSLAGYVKSMYVYEGPDFMALAPPPPVSLDDSFFTAHSIFSNSAYTRLYYVVCGCSSVHTYLGNFSLGYCDVVRVYAIDLIDGYFVSEPGLSWELFLSYDDAASERRSLSSCDLFIWSNVDCYEHNAYGQGLTRKEYSACGTPSYCYAVFDETGAYKEYYIDLSEVPDSAIHPVDPELYPADTRPDALLQALEEYNKNHPYQDNSVPNFMIGALDADGNLQTETDINGVVIPQLYPPTIYDEETLIFTEPVTGAQYQTLGWTYDYDLRMYTLDIKSGTLYVDDTDIRTIFLHYGDDVLTISYCDENMSTIKTDTFAYVTVASSSCTLDGHRYNVETTKDASCTSIGERRYTCSVCGDQYVEEIPMDEHIPVHSVLNEATCTDPGLSVYTCATCGGQYTEKLDPLGHDWVSTSVVETTYALPAGTACPDCSGSDFVSALDEASSTYACTCNSCGASWSVPAEVVTGYIVYTCSRCEKTRTEYSGESGDGLFTSIGNFFANGITWCTEKLTQLVDNLGSMIDTFNEYLDDVEKNTSAYPDFLGSVVGILPEDLMAVIWLGVIAFVVLAVIKIWFR